MKSEIVKTTDTSTTLKVTMDQQAFAPVVRRTMDQLRGRVRVAGFRPGKAPDHIVERELGSGMVQNEVLEAAVRHSYVTALDQHNVAAVAAPEISVAKFVPYDELEYTAVVDHMPVIKLPDYKALGIKPPAVTVAANEVDGVIGDLRLRLAPRQTAQRPAADGDEVVIDFQGNRDGQPVPGAGGKDYPLRIGSKAFIPGFEEQLLGLQAGDSKTFDIKFPKDYGEASLAGQTVSFTVSVKEVKSIELPELNDALAASVGPFKTMDELRADIERRLKAEKAEAANQEHEQAVLAELIKRSKPTLPDSLVKQQLQRIKRELAERLAANGLSLDKYLQMKNLTEEQLTTEMRPEAERRVALAMILTEVAKQEGLSVSPAEVTDEIKRLRDSYRDPQMQAELDNTHIKEDVYNHLMASKTIAKILEYNQ